MSHKFDDYTIKVFFDKRDGDFGAFIEEIPDVSAYGENQETAVAELRTVFEDWKQIAIEKGLHIPPPYDAREYSGKFLLRVPKTLHKQIAERAKEDNISINQEVLYCLTRGLCA